MSLKWFILSFLYIVVVSAHALKCENAFSPWMSFEEAKAFIQKQWIAGHEEFRKWSRSGKRPKNFPSHPEKIYEKEWTNWEDFLGTGNVYIVYKGERTNWRDFLGTGNVSTSKREWMSFEEAKAFIQRQGLQNSTEFQAWSKSGKRPKNFPSNPNTVYRSNWTNWRDFLGTGNVSTSKREWMSFEKAKAFIQRQGLQNSTEFQAWSKSGKRPKNFPSNPNTVYRSNWTNWRDFLGTGNVSTNKREWMSFEEAKAFIQRQGITNQSEFHLWSKSGKRPKNFPSNPSLIYRNEWTNWGDFLGTGNVSTSKREWMSFEEAKAFIQRQGLQNSTDFQAWSKSGKRPKNFPSNPNTVYRSNWTNWRDFLNAKNISTQNKTVKIHIKPKERKQTGSRVENVQIDSDQVDKGQLSNVESTSDRNVRGKRSVDHVRAFLKQGNVVTHGEFEEETQTDNKMDSNQMDQLSNAESTSDGDENQSSFDQIKSFLEQEARNMRTKSENEEQIDSRSKIKKYISYKEAKAFVQELGITSPIDFFKIKKSEPDIFPENFPPNPKLFYSKKGKWTSWDDFLGLKDKSQENTRLSNFNPADILDSQNNTDEDNQIAEEGLLNDELDHEENFTDDFL